VAALDPDVAYEPDAQRAAQDARERFGSRRVAHQINSAQRIVGRRETDERSEGCRTERAGYVQGKAIRMRRDQFVGRDGFRSHFV
jgi:hypothetical protein